MAEEDLKTEQEEADSDLPEPFRSEAALRRMLLVALVVAPLLTLAGWFTDVREAGYGMLISALSVAFLPFVAALLVVSFFVSLSLLLLLLSIFSGDGGPPVFYAGEGITDLLVGPFARLYYRLLFRIKHPLFWGGLLGSMLGGGVLVGLYFLIILPPEKDTVSTMVDMHGRISEIYERTKGYPDPTDQGHLEWRALGVTDRGRLVTDGFGRPMVYRKQGAWRYASWSLRSLGRDGIEGGGDDFMIQDQTTLRGIARALRPGPSGNENFGLRTAVRSIDQLRVREEQQ